MTALHFHTIDAPGDAYGYGCATENSDGSLSPIPGRCPVERMTTSEVFPVETCWFCKRPTGGEGRLYSFSFLGATGLKAVCLVCEDKLDNDRREDDGDEGDEGDED